MSCRRLSSIFASSSSSASSTASTSAPVKLLHALPPTYAVFKEQLLSGTLGPDDARQLCPYASLVLTQQAEASGHVPPRLSSIFASSSKLCILHSVYLGAAKLVCALPPAYAVFKERLLSGTLGPDDARHLFDEVLLDCDLAKAPNQLLSALARAPPSVASSDGPAFAIELFQTDGPMCQTQAAPNGYTYSILIDCYRRAPRPD
ncbi:hypothetical protein GUJ93_ZPchr0061g33660 [Zizania palustris]|uniref:Uncharacterized protein n=1 Tax=Zizania palustris TaxID=103762 RepID=A0A8J5QW38_ZIZPA|nr:hypothetical protein GUJ93_ZPchr0061g33660 [Zizania palustris]